MNNKLLPEAFIYNNPKKPVLELNKPGESKTAPSQLPQHCFSGLTLSKKEELTHGGHQGP